MEREVKNSGQLYYETVPGEYKPLGEVSDFDVTFDVDEEWKDRSISAIDDGVGIEGSFDIDPITAFRLKVMFAGGRYWVGKVPRYRNRRF